MWLTNIRLAYIGTFVYTTICWYTFPQQHIDWIPTWTAIKDCKDGSCSKKKIFAWYSPVWNDERICARLHFSFQMSAISAVANLIHFLLEERRKDTSEWIFCKISIPKLFNNDLDHLEFEMITEIHAKMAFAWIVWTHVTWSIFASTKWDASLVIASCEIKQIAFIWYPRIYTSLKSARKSLKVLNYISFWIYLVRFHFLCKTNRIAMMGIPMLSQKSRF